MPDNLYDFECADFGVSEKGIHLLRAWFNYKTIEYSDIEKATVKKGKEIKNYLLTLIIGVILLVFAIYQSVHVFQLFNDPEMYHIDIDAILLPVFPGLVGGYMLYVASKRGPLLIIETNKGKHTLRLREFTRNNKMQEMLSYFKEKLSYKFHNQL